MATILLVDDEKIVRTLLAVALRRQDHTVIEASSGTRALKAIRKHSAPDLLLSELALPRMSAIELARSLTERVPQVRALFLSRSPHPVRLEARAVEAGHTVLREPFDFSTVVGKVAELLDEPQTRKPPARSSAADRATNSATGRR